MLAFSVARLTTASATPGTALRALSTRPTQDAQVIPSMGSDIVPDGSVARTGAFIAASFLSRNFSSDRRWGFQPWEGQEGRKRKIALDLPMVGSPTSGSVRPKQGEFSWNSESRT